MFAVNLQMSLACFYEIEYTERISEEKILLDRFFTVYNKGSI